MRVVGRALSPRLSSSLLSSRENRLNAGCFARRPEFAGRMPQLARAHSGQRKGQPRLRGVHGGLSPVAGHSFVVVTSLIRGMGVHRVTLGVFDAERIIASTSPEGTRSS